MGLSSDKIKATGWRPKHTSAQAIRATAQALAKEFGPFDGGPQTGGDKSRPAGRDVVR